MPALERPRQEVEALLDARKDRFRLGKARSQVDLPGDGGDLIGQPLQRPFRNLHALRHFVDALRERAETLDDLGRRPLARDLCH